MFDVIIIGLGPAGSTLARLLNGKKVLCLDKKTFSPAALKNPAAACWRRMRRKRWPGLI